MRGLSFFLPFPPTVIIAALSFLVPSARALTIGNTVAATGGLDGWNAIMVVNESDTYTNTSGGAQTVTLDQFNVNIGAVRGRVTPFVVRVNGDNNFTVLAIGATRVAGTDYTTTGVKAFAFSAAATTFTLNAGEKLAAGYTDAAPNGSGGAGSVVPFVDGGDQIWLTGGPSVGNSGTVTLGSMPTVGAQLFTTLTRQYQFNITFTAPAAGPQPPSDILLAALALFPGTAGVAAGALTSTDPNPGDTHTYSLVTNPGALFGIAGNALTFTGPAGAVGMGYTVRVRSTDQTALSLEKDFTLTVGAPLAPSSVNCTAELIPAGSAAGAALGRLSTVDTNVADAFTYALVSGAGDAGNAAFTIVNDELRLAQAVAAGSPPLSFRVRATDRAGLSVEGTFTLPVIELSVRINEFMAANATGLADEDGAQPDWIELHNPLAAPVNLASWRLTDDPADLALWTFPAVSIPAGGYLVVFASGKNRAALTGNLHSNFSLDSTGEPLLLVKPDGTIADTHAAHDQAPDISHGYGSIGGRGYLLPTPNAANGPAFVYGINKVTFSVPRGFYSAAQSLTLTADVPGSVIRYTTNGTKPSATNGLTYATPINITPDTAAATRGTRRIRAVALHAQAAAARHITHSYLFVNGVTAPATDGITTQTNTNNAAQTNAIKANATYAALMDDALLDLPAIFISNASGLPTANESETAIELIHPGGAAVENGFHVNCGIQAVGGHSIGSPKNNFRLYFRSEYGEPKLNYPLFRGHPYDVHGAVSSFDRLSLRSCSHDTFFWLADTANPPAPGTHADALYLRNILMDDIHLAMGHIAPHGRYAHCFVNGAYHGLYHIREYPNDDFLSSYMGNQAGVTYDFTNGANAGENGTPGWSAVWSNIKALAASNYAECARRVDMAQLADYEVLNFWAGNNWDWNPNQNWMAGGPNLPDAGGWKFFSYDNDIIWMHQNSNVVGRAVPDGLFNTLMNHEEFRILFRDRYYKHCFHGGVLTSARAAAMLDFRSSQIQKAIVAETARWQPGTATALPWDRDGEWQTELNRVKTQYFPARIGILNSQLVAQGWYPIAAPEFSQHGGSVAPGYVPVITGPAATTIYATTDGSDPRLPGGAINPSAFTVPSPAALAVNGVRLIRMRAKNATTWSALNEATFSSIPIVPASAANIVVSEIHYRPAIGGSEFLELMNISASHVDLSGAAFSRGIEHTVPDETVLAPGARYLITAAKFENGSALSNGGERITLIAVDGVTVIRDFAYSDNFPWPFAPDGGGLSLVLINPRAAATDARHNDGTHWRASLANGGTPRSTDGTPFTGNVMDNADNDPLTALVEYALGTSDSDSAPGPAATLVPDPAMPGTYLYTITRSAVAEEALCTVEVSTSLAPGSWTSAGTVRLSAVQTGNTIEEVWRLTPPPPATRMLVRMLVTRLP